MKPEGLSEGGLVSLNEKSGCDETEDVPEKVPSTKNLRLKEPLEIFHNIESAMHKILERSKGA